MFRVLSRHNVNFGRREFQALMRAAFEPPGAEAVTAFEEAFARYHGVRYALATGSGRAALYLALRRLDLPKGATIALPSYTFFTLPAVVEALGFKIAYVPCDPETFAIDPEKLESSLPKDTAALVVLHPFGQTAPMTPILELCQFLGIVVLEDPSQSIGARYEGRLAGSFGRAAAFSLVSGKNMTTCGGGMLITDDAELAKAARGELENAPFSQDSWEKVRSTAIQWALSTRPGFALGLFPPFLALNQLDRERLDAMFREEKTPFVPPRALSRLSPLQARLGQIQLDRLDSINAIRRANAQTLIEGLKEIPGIQIPKIVDGCEGTYNAVAVRVDDARAFRRALLNRGIDSREDYMELHDGDQIRREEVVYLPNHPGLEQKDMWYIVGVVRRVLS